MSDPMTGPAVIKQSEDESLGNTEPVALAGAVVGIVGALASILVIGGYIDDNQSRQLKDAAGQIVPAALVISAIVQVIWARARAYSPRTAALIAVRNAESPSGAAPTLHAPPS